MTRRRTNRDMSKYRVKGKIGFFLREEFPDVEVIWLGKTHLEVTFKCCIPLPNESQRFSRRASKIKNMTERHIDIGSALLSVRQHKCTPFKTAAEACEMAEVLERYGLTYAEWQELQG